MIEGEQRKHLGRGMQCIVVGQRVLVLLRLFLVFGYMLTVESSYDIDVDGDASSIAVARPLRVLCILSGRAHPEEGSLMLTISRALSYMSTSKCS